MQQLFQHMRVAFLLVSMLLCLAAQAMTSSPEPGDTDADKPVHLVGAEFRPAYVFPTYSFSRVTMPPGSR